MSLDWLHLSAKFGQNAGAKEGHVAENLKTRATSKTMENLKAGSCQTAALSPETNDLILSK